MIGGESCTEGGECKERVELSAGEKESRGAVMGVLAFEISGRSSGIITGSGPLRISRSWNPRKTALMGLDAHLQALL